MFIPENLSQQKRNNKKEIKRKTLHSKCKSKKVGSKLNVQ